MSLAWFLPLPGSYAGVDVVGVYNFACSLREVLAKHPFLPHGCGLFSGSYFPSFSEGLSLRVLSDTMKLSRTLFPFLFGGTFIEGITLGNMLRLAPYFPSFSEGLSLRVATKLFLARVALFPFLFGGTFIEGANVRAIRCGSSNFPSFSEGLSLRVNLMIPHRRISFISLPFRRDFH